MVEVVRTLSKHPLESQKRFLRSQKRFKAFSGAVGSGKSLALIYQALMLSQLNPGCLGLIGAPTYPMLRDATMREFFSELHSSEIPYEYFKAESRLVLKDSGSQIIFRAVEEFERLRGTNLAWFGLDECALCPEEAFQMLQARLRNPQANHLCGYAVTTPKGFDWFWRYFVKNEDPQYELVMANPGENKYLPPDFYKTLGNTYDERLYRQEVLGEFLNINSGRVYYPFDSTIHVKQVELNRALPIYWSLDFNLTPMCSVICQIHDDSSQMDVRNQLRRVRLEVIDEIRLNDARTEHACEEFVNRLHKMGLHHADVRIYGDASASQRQRSASAGAKSDWEMVKRCLANQTLVDIKASFHSRAANPAIRDRVAAVNSMLLNANKEIRMAISPRCKTLITDLEEVNWQEGTAQIDNSNRKLVHMSDALGYLCEKEFGRIDASGTGYRQDRLF
jgi:hypothetical protein